MPVVILYFQPLLRTVAVAALVIPQEPVVLVVEQVPREKQAEPVLQVILHQHLRLKATMEEILYLQHLQHTLVAVAVVQVLSEQMELLHLKLAVMEAQEPRQLLLDHP
jgi:hypothetical protein